MPSTNEFIKITKSWVGVPYQAIGYHRNGTNCVGLIIGILLELGMDDVAATAIEYAGFSRPLESGLLLRKMQEYFTQLDTTAVIPGDMLLYKINTEPQHVVILTEPGIIIHADIFTGKVIEQSIPIEWRPLAAFRFSELTS